jgi:hypothetical protein
MFGECEEPQGLNVIYEMEAIDKGLNASHTLGATVSPSKKSSIQRTLKIFR